VPLIRRQDPPTASLTLVMQFRANISRDEEGRVRTAERWGRLLGEERFQRLLSLSESAGSVPLTWLVDPAVLDLVRDLAQDNPGYGIGPAGTESPSPTPVPAEEGEGAEVVDGAGDEGDEPGDGEGAEAPETPSAVAEAAREFQGRFAAEASRRDVLVLPYGDMDVAAAYRRSFGAMVADAFVLTQRAFGRIDVPATSVVAPPDGTLPWDAVSENHGLPVLLRDSALPSARGTRVDAGGSSITLTDSSAAMGVPGSGRRQATLAMRQRILAEAALRALSDRADEPMVVMLPTRWDPGAGWERAEFFEGLGVPWLTAVQAGTVLDQAAAETLSPNSGRLRYREASEAAEIPAVNFVTAAELVANGRTLEVLLTQNDLVDEDLAGLAYLGTSVQRRVRPARAANEVAAIADGVERLMSKVTVTGPTFVTMTSEDGPFQVSLSNGLDQPVAVGVRARAVGTDQIQIDPIEAVELAPGGRRTVRMHANSSRTGVWPIVLQPVNADGDPLGAASQVKIRSSHVGQVIWAVLGIGSLVLLVAIILRIRRKVRIRQATHGPLLRRVQH
jgi:hypothetical protein